MSLVIFDLDGTLIDSRLDLAYAVNATRREAGMGPISNDLIYSYVGSGAPVLIRRAMGPDAGEDLVRDSLAFFLEYYRNHALDYTVLYPGVREGLTRMHADGAKLAVLTNKPVRISELILRGLGVADLFFRVYGSNSFEFKKPNPIGVDTLRRETRARRGETWMVGDTYVDVQTARNAGVAACGVTWGFQPETFREYPPDLLIGRLDELVARLPNGAS